MMTMKMRVAMRNVLGRGSDQRGMGLADEWHFEVEELRYDGVMAL
jgi:hypothetical protein